MREAVSAPWIHHQWLTDRRFVREAVSAPWIHHQWLTDRLMLEKGGFDAAMLHELSRRGHLIREGED
ncbi:hypothetical protein [Tychonema sp. BBK16]|uniref:hypothetical protein n=1 Tax=Tychonema sp. BBK16 TaxID=2699888 RepID=UPI0038D2A703